MTIQSFSDLINVDVDIEEENKALILLNSLPDEEYETFVLTLINGKQSFNYNDVSAALVNYKVRRKTKQSPSNGTSADSLMVRGRGSNRKGKGVTPRSRGYGDYSDVHTQDRNTLMYIR